MNADQARSFIDRQWQDSILPTLIEYIRIPNESPLFDDQWQANGHMDRAVELAADWCRGWDVAGVQVEVVRLPGRTPLLLVEVPGESEACTLLYGHLDKQPEMSGWRRDLGPWTPVLEGDRLYGRGGADDGYAVFASLTAIMALREQGLPHARCVLLIECCEESGSYDLPAYIDALAVRIGTPDLVVCLDSGCGNYDQLWCTTSLRGLVGGDLWVQVLDQGVHSGDAGGIVPSSFRIARLLLDRLENAGSGEILPAALHVPIPGERRQEANFAAAVLGPEVYAKFPLCGNTRPAGQDDADRILNRTWRPALEITGVSGLPELAQAGNVLRPASTLRLSLRIPPTCDAAKAAAALKLLFETEPPYGAAVEFNPQLSMNGWDAPATAPWLQASLSRASETWFQRPPALMGEGGSIPFIGMLGARFPEAQFLITGVLGPHSNAHGPNEFLHLPTARRLTGCVAQVLYDGGQHQAPGWIGAGRGGGVLP